MKRQIKNGAAKRTAKTSTKYRLPAVTDTPAKPKGLKLIFHFDASFHAYKNALLMDAEQGLYFGDVVYRGDYKEQLWKDGRALPMEEAPFEYLKRTTVKAALAWYVTCQPFAMDSTGDMTEICAMAAKLLPDTEPIKKGFVRMTVVAKASSYGALVEAGLHHGITPEEALDVFVNEDPLFEWANRDFRNG